MIPIMPTESSTFDVISYRGAMRPRATAGLPT